MHFGRQPWQNYPRCGALLVYSGNRQTPSLRIDDTTVRLTTDSPCFLKRCIRNALLDCVGAGPLCQQAKRVRRPCDIIGRALAGRESWSGMPTIGRLRR